jgi:small subunit ribosomal protein S20
MRTNIKSLLIAISAKESEKAKGLFTQVQKLMDILAKKNIIPKNRASRYKQRLNARLKAIS